MLTRYGDAGSLGLRLLMAKSRGEPVPGADLARLESETAALAGLRPKPTGAAMDGFLSRALHALE